MRKRRSYEHIFTEKVHSKKGMLGLALGILSILGGIVMVVISCRARGEGSVYLGSAGLLALFVAAAAFALAVQSMREDRSKRAFPIAATLCSGIALAGWLVLYVLGVIL